MLSQLIPFLSSTHSHYPSIFRNLFIDKPKVIALDDRSQNEMKKGNDSDNPVFRVDPYDLNRFGKNLLVNPGAESGNLSGWKVVEGSWEASNSTSVSGSYSFRALDHPMDSFAVLSQSIDVSGYSEEIDRGEVLFMVYTSLILELNSTAGGWVSLNFLNESEGVLKDVSSKEMSYVLEEECDVFFSDSFKPPLETRFIRLALQSIKNNDDDARGISFDLIGLEAVDQAEDSLEDVILSLLEQYQFELFIAGSIVGGLCMIGSLCVVYQLKQEVRENRKAFDGYAFQLEELGDRNHNSRSRVEQEASGREEMDRYFQVASSIGVSYSHSLYSNSSFSLEFSPNISLSGSQKQEISDVPSQKSWKEYHSDRNY